MKKLLACALSLGFATGASATDLPRSQASPPSTAAATAPAGDDADTRRELDQLRAQMNDLAKRMGKLSARMGDTARAYAFNYVTDPSRGMLGVVMVDDAHGRRVVAVTPGSPAEQAGLKVGDVILTVNVKPLHGHKPADSTSFDDLKVGQVVTLRLQRDGKPRTLTIKAERREAADWPNMLALSELQANSKEREALIRRGVAEAHRGAAEASRSAAEAGRKMAEAMKHNFAYLRIGAGWWGLNLASLNPDLAGYFGTDSGALVLSSEPDRYPGLKAGDVITAVDSTKVERPEDVMRALRGQSADKTVRLAVRRHNKPVTVEMKAPDPIMLLPPAPPAPPAPPVPPAPPTATAPPAPPAPPSPPTPPVDPLI